MPKSKNAPSLEFTNSLTVKLTLHFTLRHFSDLSLDELYAIMVLRQEVFIVEQTCPYLDADGKDQDSWHLMGYDDQGKLLAYSRLLPKGLAYPEHASIGRVVTSQKARGTGAGRLMMREAIKACKELFPEQPLKISAQCYLIKFYEGFGFNTVGEEYLEDDIPHIAMILSQTRD